MEFDYKGFWQDFTIAERYGEKAIKETYERCKEWKDNPEYWGALVLTLNHKIWAYYETDVKLAEIYNGLWEEAQDWGYGHFKGKDMEVFFHIID